MSGRACLSMSVSRHRCQRLSSSSRTDSTRTAPRIDIPTSRLEDLNTDEGILTGIDPALLREIKRIRQPDSRERRQLASLGGQTADQIAARKAAGDGLSSAASGSFPTEQIIVSAEDIAKLLKFGACAKEASSLKVMHKRFDSLIRTGINHITAYESFLERFATFDDQSYAKSVEWNHPGAKELPDDEDWMDLGSRLLGLHERGFLPLCSQAIFYDPDQTRGAHDSAVIGFRNLLGLLHINKRWSLLCSGRQARTKQADMDDSACMNFGYTRSFCMMA